MLDPAPRSDRERPGWRLVFDEDFDGDALDARRWTDRYLPHWSTREASRARFTLRDGILKLVVAPDQPPWCPAFDGDVRVSALQTGQWSGPLGSPFGQHRFNPACRVREEQPQVRLFTPHAGRIELRARARLDATSLASLYLIGFEDRPEDSGEVTVMEVFGRGCGADGTRVGRGVKAITDRRLATEFTDDALPLRVGDWHVYAVEWSAAGCRFSVDGQPVGRTRAAPDYPMQLMLTFYRLPPDGSDVDPEACFEVDYVRAWERPGPPSGGRPSPEQP